MSAKKFIRHDAHTAHAKPYKIPHRHLMSLPILSGPMRGKYWLPASGGKIMRVMLGSYEREQTALFQQHLSPGDILFDVGAAVGYYTLLGSQLVGNDGKVVSFEPDPKNAAFLNRHVEANRLANVTTLQSAVGDTDGVLRFAKGTGTGTGHLSADGDIEVHVCRLDDMVGENDHLPTAMKIDVEGAELRVLQGAVETLRRARPTLFLSTHGQKVHDASCRFLQDLDYILEPIIGDDLATTSEVLCRAA